MMSGSVGLFLLSAMVCAAAAKPVDMGGRTCTDFGCHADLQVKAVVHDPVAKGMCHPCHMPSRPDVHEFQAGYSRETLCVACHITIRIKATSTCCCGPTRRRTCA
jgi:predicted CXXCH cytochrome family protein